MDRPSGANSVLDSHRHPNQFIMNLSSHKLMVPQIQLLSNGLSFSTTPGQPELSKIQEDFDRFHCSLRHFFHEPELTDNQGSQPTPSGNFLPNNNWKDVVLTITNSTIHPNLTLRDQLLWKLSTVQTSRL